MIIYFLCADLGMWAAYWYNCTEWDTQRNHLKSYFLLAVLCHWQLHGDKKPVWICMQPYCQDASIWYWKPRLWLFSKDFLYLQEKSFIMFKRCQEQIPKGRVILYLNRIFSLKTRGLSIEKASVAAPDKIFKLSSGWCEEKLLGC